MPDPASDTGPPRLSFNEWLAGHARGTLNDELTAALGEVVEAVAHQAKVGTLTLKLKVSAAGSGGRTVVIEGEVNGKPPRPASEQSIFYVGDGGSLHRDDPYARRLPGVPFANNDGELVVIDSTTGELRRLDGGEGA